MQAILISLNHRIHMELILWNDIKKMETDFSQPSGRIQDNGHKLKHSKFCLNVRRRKDPQKKTPTFLL